MMSHAPVLVADTGLPERATRSLDIVAGNLAARGSSIRRIGVAGGLPDGFPSTAQRTWQAFTATPDDLIESWRVARHLETETRPGDLVLLSDHRGTGGIFALEQAMAPVESRRLVLVVAADSITLDYLAIAGTVEGAAAADQSAIDWELATYRYAHAVLATSEAAVQALESLNLPGVVAVLAEASVSSSGWSNDRIRLPEPVSRRAATPTIIRALGGLLDELPELEISISVEDRGDGLWSGSTWDSIEAMRRPVGDRIGREKRTDPGDLIVLGDPYAVPSGEVIAHRGHGGAVIVRDQSTAAALWPDAPTWSSADDLALQIMADDATTAGAPSPALAGADAVDLAPTVEPPRAERARHVSVGIPIFADVTFLDECVMSVLDQEQSPIEILLLDDGSRSPEVDAAIDDWERRHPELIRAMRHPNRGVSVARNRAMETMRGDAFVFVDSDDTLDPSFIGACAESLRARPALSAVATWTEFFGEYEGIEAKAPFDARVGRRENPIISTGVLVDMSVRDAGIRFEPDLAFIYCEDWDFWSKIVAAGGELGLVPRPLVRHRVHPSSGGHLRTDLAHSIGRARATAALRTL